MVRTSKQHQYLLPEANGLSRATSLPLKEREIVLTPCAQDLVAHGKTRQEIAQHIHADEVIFQDLDDLKASCIEAAEGPTEIDDFEVGVFCGKYVTDVPEGYFEHLSRLRGKERKTAARAIEAAEPGQGHATVVTNSGPVNVASRGDDDDDAGEDGNENGSSRPEHREDIRYVAVCSVADPCLLTDALTVFTTSRANSQCTRNSRAQCTATSTGALISCNATASFGVRWPGCAVVQTATVDGMLTR